MPVVAQLSGRENCKLQNANCKFPIHGPLSAKISPSAAGFRERFALLHGFGTLLARKMALAKEPRVNGWPALWS